MVKHPLLRKKASATPDEISSVLRVLKEKKQATTQEIAAALGWSHEQTYGVLRELQDTGMVGIHKMRWNIKLMASGKKADQYSEPGAVIPEDTRPGGTGDYEFYKSDPGSPAGEEEWIAMKEMGIRGSQKQADELNPPPGDYDNPQCTCGRYFYDHDEKGQIWEDEGQTCICNGFTPAKPKTAKAGDDIQPCCGAFKPNHKPDCKAYNDNFNKTVEQLKALPKRSADDYTPVRVTQRSGVTVISFGHAGHCVIHPEEMENIKELQPESGTVYFRDEQGISWQVSQLDSGHYYFQAQGPHGMHGVVTAGQLGLLGHTPEPSFSPVASQLREAYANATQQADAIRLAAQELGVTLKVASNELWREFRAHAEHKDPTRKHRPAIWENMLGTVYAMSPKREIRYFDYNYDDAVRFTGYPLTAGFVRVARVPRTMNISWGESGAVESSPRPGKLVWWVVDVGPEQSAKQSAAAAPALKADHVHSFRNGEVCSCGAKQCEAVSPRTHRRCTRAATGDHFCPAHQHRLHESSDS